MPKRHGIPHLAGGCAIAAATLSAAAFAVTAWTPAAQTPRFDLVIRGGRVADGTGNPWFAADVAISADTIALVAPRIDPDGARTIDASGLVVAPGFIDVHSHSEADQGIVRHPDAANNVRQGVTTVFANPDGGGDVEIKAFLDRVAAARPAINVGAFVGHGPVRTRVMGLVDRHATEAELGAMRALVRTAMADGAFGLSTGLFYVPGAYASLDEVVELAREAGHYGGIHKSHMRDEAGAILDSVRDTIAIGERGGLPTQITHHKVVGKRHWGRSRETLRLVDDARARGVDVTIDLYPYTASSTSIEGGLVPAWAREGGRDALLNRLGDPVAGARARKDIASSLEHERGSGDPDNVVLASCPFDPALAGKGLGRVLRDRGQTVSLEAAAALVVEIIERGGCTAVYHVIGEEDLVRILGHPAAMVASDAFPGEPEFGRDMPHPRAYGTFARVLSRYVREQRVLTLEDAVRKMSSFPAARMKLWDRGLVRAGMKADLAVFDPERVDDRATFERPHQYAAGVVHVLVNGSLVLEHGTTTAARPGRVLRGPGAIARPAETR
jgi:dihydroorotase/N-acyl-D-amino-acid deacylase